MLHNVCSAEKLTKRSSNTVLRLVSFSAEQTLSTHCASMQCALHIQEVCNQQTEQKSILQNTNNTLLFTISNSAGSSQRKSFCHYLKATQCLRAKCFFLMWPRKKEICKLNLIRSYLSCVLIRFGHLTYCKVTSSRLSWLAAHPRVFRGLMKRKFDAYVL